MRIKLKNIILHNLKAFLETFRSNPATGLLYKILAYCKIISNAFDLFDEVAEVLERTDSNYHKQVSENLAEEAPCRLLQSDPLTLPDMPMKICGVTLFHAMMAIQNLLNSFISCFSCFR